VGTALPEIIYLYDWLCNRLETCDIVKSLKYFLNKRYKNFCTIVVTRACAQPPAISAVAQRIYATKNAKRSLCCRDLGQTGEMIFEPRKAVRRPNDVFRNAVKDVI